MITRFVACLTAVLLLAAAPTPPPTASPNPLPTVTPQQKIALDTLKRVGIELGIV